MSDEELRLLKNISNEKPHKKKKRLGSRIIKLFGRIVTIILVTVSTVTIVLLITLFMICRGPSQKAKELFVTTMLETGQMKFAASIFLSDKEISSIVNSNSMDDMSDDVDTGLIKVDDTDEEDPIQLIKISGSTYEAKLLIIKDPSRVKVATTYPWTEYGTELDKLVTNNNSVAGINGGLYYSSGNKGGKPLGVVVSDGKIQYNDPTETGLYLIGMDEENILKIISLSGMSASDVEALVKKEKIRDAVAFQEESSDKNNHFVKLVINGEARETNGAGSGANPRTAIGQRADGAILMLVTDGRGASGHLGATASDLIDIMTKYGAINAANLDGGSSSSMYYDGKYEMTSVTLYYSNSSWKLPTAFVVEER